MMTKAGGDELTMSYQVLIRIEDEVFPSYGAFDAVGVVQGCDG